MRVRGASPPLADLRRFGPVRDNARVVISYNFSSAGSRSCDVIAATVQRE
jgi:hypothetical protein